MMSIDSFLVQLLFGRTDFIQHHIQLFNDLNWVCKEVDPGLVKTQKGATEVWTETQNWFLNELAS